MNCRFWLTFDKLAMNRVAALFRLDHVKSVFELSTASQAHLCRYTLQIH